MKKYTFTAFELLRFLIENEYLKGVHGYFNGGDSLPETYGKNITQQITEFSYKYLEPWADPDFVERAHGMIPIPSEVSIKYSLEGEKIIEEYENGYSSWEYPIEDDIEQEIIDLIEENLSDQKIKIDEVYMYVEGHSVPAVGYFDMDGKEYQVNDANLLSEIKYIMNNSLESVLGEIEYDTLDFSIEGGMVNFRMHEKGKYEHFESDSDFQDGKTYEITVTENGNLSFVENS